MIKQTQLVMGMPITVAVVDNPNQADIDTVFGWFRGVDMQFSPFKASSEVSRLASGELDRQDASGLMREILARCQAAERDTNGYFSAWYNRRLDPSGLVKGWSIRQAADLLISHGHRHFYIEAGGDITAHGHNPEDHPWQVGIRHPRDLDKVVKTIKLSDQAIATSGTYIRGHHIYNPLTHRPVHHFLSLSVIGPDIETADILATAAFAMGAEGLDFLQTRPDYEGLAITNQLTGISTPGFDRYTT